jgi:hypothetical protein
MKQTNNKFTCTLCALAGVAAFGVAGSVHGALAIAGSDINLGSGWRSGAVPSDIDGNGVLGSDGYAFVRGPLEIVNPSYGTLSGLSTSVYNGGAGYVFVDDPLTTPGGAPTTVESGTWNPSGTDTNIARLTLNRDLVTGETIRIGLMVDNLDATAWNPASIRVGDSSGGDSGQITLADPTENQVPDWYYFDITGLSNGATVDFYSTQGINGGATLGAISLDSSVVPEPSTTALLGLGGLALILRRRK